MQPIVRMALVALLLLVAMPAAGTAQTGSSATSYIVIARDDRLLPSTTAEIEGLGGTVVHNMVEIGALIVESNDGDFPVSAGALGSVDGVVRNITVNWLYGEGQSLPVPAASAPAFWSDSLAPDAPSPLDWDMQVIAAPPVWSAGYTGQSVRVAVLDGGFFVSHPELASSFDANDPNAYIPIITSLPLANTHGTHVAGIIAADLNGFGTNGVAPDVDLVYVEVLDNLGFGQLAHVVAGIDAVTGLPDPVDVINMSLGILFECPAKEQICYTRTGEILSVAEVKAYTKLMKRAVDRAHQRGITLVASAGNEGLNLDRDREFVRLPADLSKVITVGATGPATMSDLVAGVLDTPAAYSNLGKQTVLLTAPGGTAAVPVFNTVFCPPCVDFVVPPNPLFQFYFGLSGTSMAAAHVSGIAALVIGAAGGHMPPDRVEAVLRQSAEDLGKPGVDEFYGHGRVNACKAVELVTGQDLLCGS